MFEMQNCIMTKRKMIDDQYETFSLKIRKFKYILLVHIAYHATENDNFTNFTCIHINANIDLWGNTSYKYRNVFMFSYRNVFTYNV